jgi:hypothetical protein
MNSQIPATQNLVIELANKTYQVRREVRFPNGDSISFCVSMKQDNSLSVLDIHEKSVEQLIADLSQWLQESKAARAAEAVQR